MINNEKSNLEERTGTAAAAAVVPSPGGGAAMLRLGAGIIIAGAVTAVLFWTMQYLISTADSTLDQARRGHVVDFVRVEREERVQRRQRKPEKPPAPEAPPPEPPTPKLDPIKPTAQRIEVARVPVGTDIRLSSGFNLGAAEGDFLPIVKVEPPYPRRAIARGIEGFCVVEYTVTATGTVRDVQVVEDQCTSTLFRRPSVKAAEKFKYKPRIVDGRPVAVPGVRNRFTYRLEK